MRHTLAMACILLAGFPLLACASTGSAAAAAQVSGTEEELRQTLAAHVEAVQNRDLDALIKTITEGEHLTLIFPDGTTYSTRQEYLDFHREWFADTSWTMEMEPVSLLVRGDLGIALMRTTYTDQAGPRQALLSLTFSQEEGQWRLVFDQNTRIVAK
jgi:ketosteroid isomerase-like protein